MEAGHKWVGKIGMARDIIAKKGFLGRLLSNQAGNVLAMTAAAILPIVALVGGGVDVSRYYITKSRLQNACDSAVLAARKSMVGTAWTNADETRARSFFNTNFPTGMLGSTDSGIEFDVDESGVVDGTATATSPATLMSLFHVGDKVLTATCRADLKLPNSDVMFVLDTTLSMLETNPGDAQNRLVSMRAAVQNFYTRLQAAKAPGTQVRYGFVPYSSTVNVGLLLKREWMVDTAPYQSREGNMVETVPGAVDNAQTKSVTTDGPWGGSKVDTVISVLSENCTAPANQGYTDVTNWSSWSPNASSVPRYRTGRQKRNGTTYSGASRNATTGVCTYTKTVYTNYERDRREDVIANPNYGNTGTPTYKYWYNYLQRQITVSALKGSLASGLMAGGQISVPNFDADNTNHSFKAKIVRWGTGTFGACIEERKTLHTDDLVGTAFDMDIDLVPNPANPDTQWRPALPGLVYARSVGNYYPTGGAAISGWTYPTVTKTTSNYITPSSYPSDFAACPSAASRLSEITSSQLTTYLNSLNAAGRTYHDIGMLWGLRLLSAQGLFAADNNNSSNGGSIDRHLIFMTDGATETNIADYDAYGLAALDRRRTAAPTTTLPTNPGQNAIVEDRLLRLCTAGRNKGITIWVIAFGTSLTDLMRDCAKTRNFHAFQANNTTELESAFSIIAGEIAQLRLTQ